MGNFYDRENPSAAIPQLEKKIDELSNSFIDRVYPVGSYYYTSRADVNPNLWGGKWEKETQSDPYTWHRIR